MTGASTQVPPAAGLSADLPPLRVVHIGNVANNAYNNAKFQRRYGLLADMYHYRNEFIMGHPEWEDADFDLRLSSLDPPDWQTVHFTNGYVRPSWARYLSDAPEMVAPAPEREDSHLDPRIGGGVTRPWKRACSGPAARRNRHRAKSSAPLAGAPCAGTSGQVDPLQAADCR